MSKVFCPKCKKEWEASTSLSSKICPHCGNILIDVQTDFASFENGIDYIVGTFSPEIVEQKRFFFECLKKCLPDYPREIKAISVVYDTGISKKFFELKKEDSDQIERLRKRSVYQLRLNNGLSDIWAKYAIDSFLYAIGYIEEVNSFVSYLHKAEKGDPVAQYEVGIAYKNGTSISRSVEQAKVWLTKSSNQGNADAQYALSQILSVEGHAEESEKYLLMAVDNNHENAILDLARSLIVKKEDNSFKRAIDLLETLVQRNNITALKELGHTLYQKGEIERGLIYLHQAADLGSVTSICEVAWHDIQFATELSAAADAKNRLQTALAMGCIDAAYYLGAVYEGKYLLARSINTSINMYQKAARSGHVDAALRLGQIYLYGTEGVDPDEEKAWGWYSSAAVYGNEYAEQLISYKNIESPFREHIYVEMDDGSSEKFRINAAYEYNDRCYLEIDDNGQYVIVEYTEPSAGQFQLSGVEEQQELEISRNGKKLYEN